MCGEHDQNSKAECLSLSLEHLDRDHLNPSCEHCGKMFNTVNPLTQHISICEKARMNCVLEPYGCNEQFLRMNIRDHFLSVQHQSALLQYLCKNTQHQINDELVISSRTKITINRETDEIFNRNLQQLLETTDVLLGGVSALTDDAQRLSSELLHHQTLLRSLSEKVSNLKIAVEETHSSINAHQTNQQICEEGLTSLQQQFEDQKNISTDGKLMWKITNVQQKIVDAEFERQISFYSPVFYSSPNGYKMRLRLYLAGDGNARRTHMSLFFVLMRGEYDAILEFPFSFKVIFCLIDQTSQQRHIIDSFRPDVKSSSFQRPQSDMNTASGIPKFVPLTIIQQDDNPYVRDDTMFIKVIVDFGDIPKLLLPYTLSLNPGLPILLQHEWIRREIEKKAQQNTLNTTSTSLSMDQDMNTNENGNRN
ncbi:unnamed protein product [Rotaria sp. Silwood1]|nr:unnamed protein product [Rotaria sp. Silwood1]CAF3664636.1 unnamed protein product [Rotaria sp. Silwood1]CAF3685761.1 unnamed protein product [Rotaria sp. Silwood1]CAF4657367.1 unnamed protein product [Rotaria sp. Silwood1]CAF4685375.1 unnamed protein product [Rotaria sp. Silwood1]